MKKISKLLMLAVVALGVTFTACNNNDLPDGPDVDAKANTHVSVTLKLSSGGRLADGAEAFDKNYLGKWGGNDEFKTVTVYLVDGTSVTSQVFTVGTDYDYTITGAGTSNVSLKPTTTAAMKTTVGMKDVYVVVNETPAVRNWLNKSAVNEFEQNYQNIALLLANEETGDDASSASKVAVLNDDKDKDVIVMTNLEPFELDVQPNISATETITGGTVATNRASLTVQRAVARAMVTIASPAEGKYAVPNVVGSDGPSVQGYVSDVTWAIAQGENSLFVQQKTDFVTPNYDWVTSGDFYSAAAAKYDYAGLFENLNNKNGGTDVPTWADYSAAADDVVANNKWLAGKFVLPTTHEYKDAPVANTATDYTGGYRKGNTAYVLIRATFEPVVDAFGDKDVAGFSYTKGQTFFVSKGKFFTSAQNAYDITGEKNIAKYEDAKVLYYAWLNPDQVPNWYNSPALRNNIYHIHITGFTNLGVNWNPLYPEDPGAYEPLVPNPEFDPEQPIGPGNEPYLPRENDPNNPDPKPTPDPVYDRETPGDPSTPIDPNKPVDPEEPTNPVDPDDPLTTSETWMSVDVSILPWKVHSYKTDLGGL